MKNQIENWLHKYLIEDYEIKDDLTIDAYKVDLSDYDIEELPDFIHFGHVTFFWINKNPRLRSKRGFPMSVGLLLNYSGGLLD
jgi:hypothetical protein